MQGLGSGERQGASRVWVFAASLLLAWQPVFTVAAVAIGRQWGVAFGAFSSGVVAC